MAEHKEDAEISHLEAREPGKSSKSVDSSQIESLMHNARMIAYYGKEKLLGLCASLRARSKDRILFFPALDQGELTLVSGESMRSQLAEMPDALHFQSEEVKSHLTNIRQAKTWLFTKVFFLVADIESLLDPEGVDGIYFLTSAITFQEDKGPEDWHTLTAIPRSDSAPSDVKSSLLPCPPNCGGDDPYERLETERPI